MIPDSRRKARDEREAAGDRRCGIERPASKFENRLAPFSPFEEAPAGSRRTPPGFQSRSGATPGFPVRGSSPLGYFPSSQTGGAFLAFSASRSAFPYSHSST